MTYVMASTVCGYLFSSRSPIGSLQSPLFEKEKIHLGVWESDTTLFMETEVGPN